MNPYAALPAVFWIAYSVFYLLYMALVLVSTWKIFVKMGVPGWKAIIPYYNLWVMIDCLRKPRSWFWILILGSIVCLAIYGVFLWLVFAENGMITGSLDHLIPLLVLMLLMLAVAVVMLIYSIRLYHALSTAFGHDAGFTVGLIFLPIVFLPILAFGPDKFLPRE